MAEVGSEPPYLAVSVAGPGSGEAKTFELGAQGGWIGRHRDCEVFVDDPDGLVSRRHARIDFADAAFWISDHSSNGTFLNGEAAPIAKGQRYSLGEGYTIRLGRFSLKIIACRTGETASAERRFAPDGAGLGRGDPLFAFGPDDLGLAGAPAGGGIAAVQPDALTAFLSEVKGQTGAARGAASESFAPRFDQTSSPAGGTPLETERAPAGADATAADRVPETAVAASFPNRPAANMLIAVANEVAEMSPALQARAANGEFPQTPESDTAPPADRYAPRQPNSALAALSAFWCGLGIIPRQLDPDDLVSVMAELGGAFRAAIDGFGRLLPRLDPTSAAENPLAAGYAALRRYIDSGGAGPLHLDDAVRKAFEAIDADQLAARAAARAACETIARELAPSAVEDRFAAMLRSRRRWRRDAELWRLFRTFEEELIQQAAVDFQNELERGSRAAMPVPRTGDTRLDL